MSQPGPTTAPNLAALRAQLQSMQKHHEDVRAARSAEYPLDVPEGRSRWRQLPPWSAEAEANFRFAYAITNHFDMKAGVQAVRCLQDGGWDCPVCKVLKDLAGDVEPNVRRNYEGRTSYTLNMIQRPGEYVFMRKGQAIKETVTADRVVMLRLSPKVYEDMAKFILTEQEAYPGQIALPWDWMNGRDVFLTKERTRGERGGERVNYGAPQYGIPSPWTVAVQDGGINPETLKIPDLDVKFAVNENDVKNADEAAVALWRNFQSRSAGVGVPTAGSVAPASRSYAGGFAVGDADAVPTPAAARPPMAPPVGVPAAAVRPVAPPVGPPRMALPTTVSAAPRPPVVPPVPAAARGPAPPGVAPRMIAPPGVPASAPPAPMAPPVSAPQPRRIVAPPAIRAPVPAPVAAPVAPPEPAVAEDAPPQDAAAAAAGYPYGYRWDTSGAVIAPEINPANGTFVCFGRWLADRANDQTKAQAQDPQCAICPLESECRLAALQAQDDQEAAAR